MFGIIMTSRGSPAPRSRPDVDRIILFPRTDSTGPEDLEVSPAGSPRVRPTAGDPSPRMRIFRSKARQSGKADLGRARSLLAADLSDVAHPCSDDPAACIATLAPATGLEGTVWDRTPALRDADRNSSPEGRFPTREREAHAFRKPHDLKFLARPVGGELHIT
jgi:hypothetical protein